MTESMRNVISTCTIILLLFLNDLPVSACSTFKLQNGNELIYGHNLNQGDIGVPGLIFINKRGVFKKGRTWSELISKERTDPSDFYWISRYGSVTFNVFGKDFPDGGMNEGGLYIWEMNEKADYPKNDSLPKLNKMNWMQFILDSYISVDEVIKCAMEFEIEGRSWHYFVGDAAGNCAAIAFINGAVVVNRDDSLPVPALFNTPYLRELELLKYFKGFGGLYNPDLDDPEVPRFVKAAVMIRDYNPDNNSVDYGFKMLDKLKVNDIPEWSIIFDAYRGDVYFKTRVNPRIKYFSMNNIDFSNNKGALIQNMDTTVDADVSDNFQSYSDKKMRDFLELYVISILPEEFFISGGLTVDEYLDRFATQSNTAATDDYQYFRGLWKSSAEKTNGNRYISLNLETRRDAVHGTFYDSNRMADGVVIEHIQLIDKHIKFTSKTIEQALIEVDAFFEDNRMNTSLSGIEDDLGNYVLIRKQE